MDVVVSLDRRASRTSSSQLDRASLASLLLLPHSPHSHYHHSLDSIVPLTMHACMQRWIHVDASWRLRFLTQQGCPAWTLHVHPEWVSSRSRDINFKLVADKHTTSSSVFGFLRRICSSNAGELPRDCCSSDMHFHNFSLFSCGADLFHELQTLYAGRPKSASLTGCR